MARKLVAVVFGALLLQFAGFANAADSKDHDKQCRALAPICHLGERPMCLCSSASMFSCGWQCVR